MRQSKEVSEDPDYYTCLMYWAPIPKIEAPEDAPKGIKEVCQGWTAKKRTELSALMTPNRTSSLITSTKLSNNLPELG